MIQIILLSLCIIVTIYIAAAAILSWAAYEELRRFDSYDGEVISIFAEPNTVEYLLRIAVIATSFGREPIWLYIDSHSDDFDDVNEIASYFIAKYKNIDCHYL